MDLNILEFFIDESKNFLGGVVNKIGSRKFNNIYYRYLDYYELNGSICNFKTINYFAIMLPVLICIILYFIIAFITKNVFNYYLLEKKKHTITIINNKRKISNYAKVDYRKNKIHKKNFNNLNNKSYP